MTEFEQVYRAYFGDVYRFLCMLSRDPALAEELTSETFFRAMDGLENFRGSCEVRVWLCQIAKNCYYSHLRSHSRLTDLSSVPPASVPGPEEALLDRETAVELRRLLQALPEPYREVFALRVFGELSFAQIGGLFSKSENWACVTYHRARKKIMGQMEEEK